MDFSREAAFDAARQKLKEAHAERDVVLLHTVKAIDECDKAVNLFMERLREWYGIYFPELDVADPEAYCKIVLLFDKQNIELSTLSDIVGPEKAKEIISAARGSVGAKFAEEDLAAVRALASRIADIFALRNEIAEYEERVAKKLAPNLCYLVEPALAAKLIAQAGGIKRLALFPASTVQVLGAEKALFKHLRKGSLPPKYGLIFQDPLIGNAPYGHGGKLARALATKLSIAAKADAFSHNFIAGKLKETLGRREKEIAKLPVKEKKPLPQFQQGQRPPFGGGRDRFAGKPRFSDRPRPRQEGGFKREGEFGGQGFRPQGSFTRDRPQGGFRREGNWQKPSSGFRREGQGGNFRQGGDRPQGNFRRDRPEGGFRREGQGGAPKREYGPRQGGFRREGGRPEGGFRREGGFGGQPRQGGFRREGSGPQGNFRREGGRPEGGFNRGQGNRDFRRKKFDRR